MRVRGLLLILFLLALLVPEAGARELLQGDDCEVAAGKIIAGDLFVLCRSFVLNGEVQGDLIGASFSAELNGVVDGNVYLIAGQLDTHSHIGRDLLYAGPLLRVHPGTIFEDPRGDLMSLGLSTEVLQGARVPGSIASLGYQLLLGGDVGREVHFWGSALHVDGHVDGDVQATVGDPETDLSGQLQTLLVPFRFDAQLVAPGLIVSDQGQIDGQLSYSSTEPGQIDGTLGQDAVFERVITTPDFSQLHLAEESNAASLTNYLAVVIRELISVGLVGLLALLFIPRPLQAPLPYLRARPLAGLGLGLLAFVLSILAWLIVLIVLIVAIVLFIALHLPDLTLVAGMGIVVLNVGGVGVFYFVAVFLARLVACLLVGRLIVRLTLGDDGTPRMIYFDLLTGVILLSFLAHLPLIGPIVNVVALIFGLGGIFMNLTQQELQHLPRRVNGPNRLPPTPESPRQIPPPPIIDQEARGLGMDNLPEGFRWWPDDD